MERKVVKLVPETSTAKKTEEKPKNEQKIEHYEDRKPLKNRVRRIKGLTPFARIVPYIMENRIGSQNSAYIDIDMDIVEKYIKKKQAEGLKYFNLMHVIVASYVRMISQYPQMNRFIRGQKIYSRELVEVSLVVKREMSLDAPDTVIKLLFEPWATADDVYHAFNNKIEEYRNQPDSSFDKLAKTLNYIPGIFLRWTVKLLRGLDYLGWLPSALTGLSPFHGSLFITSMGSLGVPPIVHHLYDFGNIPMFIAFGTKMREMKVDKDGKAYCHHYVGMTINMDERICDGYCVASAMKCMTALHRHPEKLDLPPQTIVKDID